MPQQAVADALTRNPPQLFLDRLEQRRRTRPALERGVQIHVADVEPSRVHAGEPADGPCQIGTGHRRLLTAVALEIDEHAASPVRAAPCGDRQRQRREQTVVDARTVLPRNHREHGSRGLRAEPDLEPPFSGGHIDPRIERAPAHRLVAVRDDPPPVLELGLTVGAAGGLGESVRPSAHRGSDRRKGRGRAGGDAHPRECEVGDQRAPRHTVDGEVVHDGDQSVSVGLARSRESDELRHDTGVRTQAARRLGRDSADLLRELGRSGASPGGNVRDQRCRVHAARRSRDDDGFGAVRAQHRAQHVVMIHDGGDGGGDALIARARREDEGQRLCERLVASEFEHLVHHRGQRHRPDALARKFGQLRLCRVGGPRHLGQTGHRLLFEDLARGEDDAEVLGPRHQLQGDDAVAAELEEARVGADTVETEDVGEDLGDPLLQLGQRLAVLRRARAEVGIGQGGAIELAVHRERHLVEHDHRGGHHVFGQHLSGGDPQTRRVQIHAVLGQHVGDQLWLTG
ncbi:hypothetical protein GCM10009855_08390 [Gordonia cholesterolivorans]|uniref:Uncharacterized protein n=1 Tax=Gordonia cholesterolivorans TaxID=559625 RepID=A0ABN3H7E2_9ACTN